MKETVIELKNITKNFKIPIERRTQMKDYFIHPFRKAKYRSFVAVDNVSFSVSKGEFLGIIGRNGSGKSTLLKIISNIYLPNKGEVISKGKLIPFLELGVGFNPELTAKDNVFLNGVILGLTRDQIKAKYKSIIEFSELQGFEETQLKNFSSGMQVRLAFSIAIQSEGDIYILDEVLAVGDLAFQQKCFDMFRTLKQQGKTIIFVSHSMGAIEEFCDRVILLEKGSISKEGKAFNVLQKYSEISFNKSKISKADKIDEKLKIKLLNSKGEDTSIFDSNEKVTISLEYNLKEIIVNPNIEFIITRDDGTVVSSISTYNIFNIDKLEKKGHINFVCNNLKLISSEYFISIVIYNKDLTEQLVSIERIKNFKIFSKKTNIKGFFEIDGNWSF
jgi:ABC-2 type transport system ATP-binding protein